MKVRPQNSWVGVGVFGLLLGALAMSSAVGDTQEKTMLSLSKVQIEAAQKQRVIFGHQSVGANILEGVSKISKEEGVPIRIVEASSDASGNAGIYHFAVGANGDPIGKIRAFEKAFDAKSFDNVDVALVKICYVDLSAGSDAQAIAETYVSTLKKLQDAHPKTRFVAVTAPLTAVREGPKEWLKSALGRSSPDAADNAKRKVYNDLLRKQFDARHLFDIAKLEAGPTSAGTEALRSEISSDGGHLNDRGQRELGAAFIQLIAAQN
jgi:hypothetical protein